MIRRFIESGRGSLLTNNTLSKQDYNYVRNKLKEKLRGRYIINYFLKEIQAQDKEADLIL